MPISPTHTKKKLRNEEHKHAPCLCRAASSVASPTLFHGLFNISSSLSGAQSWPADTFLDTRGWGKGVAWINGFNLGHYWPVRRPFESINFTSRGGWKTLSETRSLELLVLRGCAKSFSTSASGAGNSLLVEVGLLIQLRGLFCRLPGHSAPCMCRGLF